VDWEAILSQHPDAFIERLARWFLPDTVREALGGPPSSGGGGGGSSGASPPARTSSGGGSQAASPRGDGGGGGGGRPMFAGPRELPQVVDLPRAGEVLATMRRRIEALNGPSAPRLQL
jgi:hypothetical protein